MPLSYTPSHGRTVCCLICLHAALLFSSIAVAQQQGNLPADTTRTGKSPHYFSITVLTGGGVQFFRRKSGLFSVGFPYTVTDASGTTADTFSAQQRNVFGSARVFIGPLAFEAGRLHNFFHGEFSFSLGKGTSAPGWKALIGYGKICYTGRYAIKFSLNLSLATTPRQGGDQLGSIDNTNKTIDILGWEAPPSFISGRYIYNATNLEITYSEHEWSLLPKVSILPNPYRKPYHFELSIGYNLPISDEGGLNLVQQGSTTSEGSISHVIPGPGIPHSGIAASYNNQPLKAPLYRFGGVYLEARYDVINRNDKKKKRA